MNRATKGTPSPLLTAEARDWTRTVRVTIAHSLPALLAAGQVLAQTSSAGPELRRIRETQNPTRATLRVHAGERAAHPIPRFITGEFAEHLGANIYGGMDVQILRNPTFADYPFWTGEMTPDGVTKFYVDNNRIAQEVRRQATRYGWPESALDDLVVARADGLACFWTREGEREAVQVSPDTGVQGGRAQRVQVRATGQGIAQWVYLPLHRVRRYEFDILARSPDLTSLTVKLTGGRGSTRAAGEAVSPALRRAGDSAALPSRRAEDSAALPRERASVTVKGLSATWKTFDGTLELPANSPRDAAHKLAVTANAPGQFVVGHIFLRPADHVHGADPDIVRLLKESHLPLLRWPGGNFASTYHWEDGVGPVEGRPTKPNYAWGAIEPNTFGTDEFIAFCRAAGCEPMICINAGSGTPEEAAGWIEYCNGPANSPMGARRAVNGHREPYRVKYWEVGNELWGRWQDGWTSAAGYADRYRKFSKSMLAADSSIRLYACGAPVLWGKNWNDTLIAGDAPMLGAITDHPLIGGTVSSRIDPLDVYRDFMDVPEVLQRRWAALEEDMSRGGVKQPRLAVTELQMFAHLGRVGDGDAAARLTRENLVNPGTLAEALYDVLIYHAAVRLGPFVELVTHSAVVNHGGGLRKEHERVYANPCFYAQAAFAAFAGATPVALDLETPLEHAPVVLPDLEHAGERSPLAFGAVDGLAAVTDDGGLLLSIVHRGTAGPIHLSVALEDFKSGDVAEVRTLSADVPWAANSLDAPQAVKPRDSTVAVKDGRIELDVPRYTVLRVRVPAGR